MDSFAACTDSAAGFDELWGELFPDQSELALVQKASIKAAWKKLQQRPATSQAPDPSHQAASSVNSWNEVQAPKLSAQTLAELKRAFFRDYPSEVLSPDTSIRTIDRYGPFTGAEKGYRLDPLEI